MFSRNFRNRYFSFGNTNPHPLKLEFDSKVELDIVKQGDSHNPDDPFFKKNRGSVLQTYGVDSVQKLPVNMGGIIGMEGERLTKYRNS